MAREGKKDLAQDQVLNLNIGGQKFTLHRDSILSQPDTKLAKMIREGKLEPNYGDSLHKRQYYFERPPEFFGIIHKFYRTGTLPLSEMNLEMVDLWDELAYWEINFPPRLTKLVDFFLETKENVETYLDGLLFMKTKRPNDDLSDLYFQAFPPTLTLYHDDDETGETKKYTQEPVHEDMNEKLYSLLKKVAKGTRDKTGISLPLKKYGKIKFMRPFSNATPHPVLCQTNTLVVRNLNEVMNITSDVLPTPLAEIIDCYLYTDEFDDDYLRIGHALYSSLIDAAALFDNNDDPYCPFARQYATKYLDKKGVKSCWVERYTTCDEDIESVYPLQLPGKCSQSTSVGIIFVRIPDGKVVVASMPKEFACVTYILSAHR